MAETLMLAPVASRAAAWESVYAELAPELLAFLVKLTGESQTAADLLQETFVRAIRSDRSPRELDSPRAWLYRIATNLARDDRRRARLRRWVSFSGHERADLDVRDPDLDLVVRTLRSLPQAQASALVLHYDAGFSRKELAAISGVSEEAIKSRLARGRENFMRTFMRLGGERP